MKSTRFSSTTACLGIFLFFFSTLSQANNDVVLTVGVVPQFEIRKLQKIWAPILLKLEKNTGLKLTLKAAPSIPAFEKAFLNGEYDFAYMNPFHAIIANEAQGYIPLVRDHGKKLSGILTVRNDSSIRRVTDLDGKKIAFPSPNALGASLQMRAELHDLFNIKIKPMYVKTHDSVYLNVLLKNAAAGGGVQKTLNRQKNSIKSALRVIHRTQPVSSHPVMIHPRVNKKNMKLIRNALLNLAKDNKGKKLLSRIPVKEIGAASMSDYNSLKKMKLKRFFVSQ